jgi:hypothetical protein
MTEPMEQEAPTPTLEPADTSQSGAFLRRVAVALAVIVAVAIPFGLVGPTKPDTDAYNKAASTALSDAVLNETTAQGAPQQAVVNGWLLRDLTLIQIKQNNDLLVLEHLIAALAVGGVLAVVISAGLYARRPSVRVSRLPG